MVLERLIRIPAAYHPRQLLQAFAHRLRHKVHFPHRQDPQQQKISGALATCITLVVWVPLPMIIVELSEFPILTQAVVLMMCLQWRNMARQMLQIATLEEAPQKQLRRTLLGHWLARDCDSLSSLGIHKGAIEGIYLRSWHTQLAPIFWFCIGGIGAALIYQVLWEVSQCWHPRHQDKSYFGWFAKKSRSLVDWLPEIVWGMWLLLSGVGQRSGLVLKDGARFTSLPRGILIAAASQRLRINMGGPALYNQVKYKRPRIHSVSEPSARNIVNALSHTSFHITMVCGLIWLLVLIKWIWLL
nr:cobalamin biosynthesis protein [Echinimonas agarilytica]